MTGLFFHTFAALALFQPSGGASPLYGTIAMYVVIIAIFYFILFRPQQQQRKKHEASIAEIKRGDEIVTAGGIIGEVVHVKQTTPDGAASAEDRITIKSAESRVVIERGKIARILKSSSSTPPASGA